MIELHARYGGGALVASTIMLAVGFIAVLFTRRWDGRQLTAELAIGAALLAGLQAFAPLSALRGDTSGPVTVPNDAPAKLASPVDSLSAHRSTPANPLQSTTPVSAVAPSQLEIRPLAQPPVAGPILSWLMLGGSALVGLYLILGWVLLWRLHFRSTHAPPMVSIAVDNLAGCRVDSRVVPSLSTAFCYGFLRPRLALPLQLMSMTAASCLESVLHHEASHLRRRDALRRTLVTAAAPVLFWNPLYWLLAREAAICAEFIADNSATRALGRRRYGRELLLLATRFIDHRPALELGGPHFLRRRGELRRRILMLHNSDTNLAGRTPLLGRLSRTAFASVSLAVLTLGFGRAPEQDSNEWPPREGEVVQEACTSLSELQGLANGSTQLLSVVPRKLLQEVGVLSEVPAEWQFAKWQLDSGVGASFDDVKGSVNICERFNLGGVRIGRGFRFRALSTLELGAHALDLNEAHVSVGFGFGLTGHFPLAFSLNGPTRFENEEEHQVFGFSLAYR